MADHHAGAVETADGVPPKMEVWVQGNQEDPSEVPGHLGDLDDAVCGSHTDYDASQLDEDDDQCVEAVHDVLSEVEGADRGVDHDVCVATEVLACHAGMT